MVYLIIDHTKVGGPVDYPGSAPAFTCRTLNDFRFKANSQVTLFRCRDCSPRRHVTWAYAIIATRGQVRLLYSLCEFGQPYRRCCSQIFHPPQRLRRPGIRNIFWYVYLKFYLPGKVTFALFLNVLLYFSIFVYSKIILSIDRLVEMKILEWVVRFSCVALNMFTCIPR